MTMLGSILSSLGVSALGKVAGGIISAVGASQAQKKLGRSPKIAGAELGGLASAQLRESLLGRGGMTQEMVAPQISTIKEKSGQATRSLLEAIQSGSQTTSQALISRGAASVADAKIRNLREVYAQQAMSNLQAKQAATQQALSASQSQAQLRLARRQAMAQLEQQKYGAIGETVSGVTGSIGEGVGVGLLLNSLGVE